MKRLLFFCLLFLALLPTWAQQSTQDVVATIDGHPIYRGEFLYAYEKNKALSGQHKLSLEKYLDLYVDYKLKVLEAQAMGLDTTKSFRQEFRQYRDQELSKRLDIRSYIDSLAQLVYREEQQALAGRDILHVSHILLKVPSTATATERDRVRLRADSLYQAIVQGADFATMARKLSEDNGTAQEGGVLPPLFPGMTVLPFEEAAYSLSAGQVSRPVLSELGYHIILMRDRKPLESYAQRYPNIVQDLQRIGAEEEAARHLLQGLQQQTGQTRAAVLDSLSRTWTKTDAKLRYLLEEYHDGLLVYQISQQKIWDAAERDSAALEATFRQHRKSIKWKRPRFKGYIVSAYDKKTAKRAAKLLRKGISLTMDTRDALQSFNKDSVIVVAKGRYLVEKGEVSTIDHLAFGVKSAKIYPLHADMPVTILAGKVEKRPSSYEDARSEVLELRQKALEAAWLQHMHQTHKVVLNKSVLQSLKTSL